MRSTTSIDDVGKAEHWQANSNWLSILTFWYTLPIFQLGNKRNMEEHDLTKPLREHKSHIVGNILCKSWSKQVEHSQKNNSTPSLTCALFDSFKVEFIIYGLVLFFMEGIRMFQPIFLGLLLRYFTPHETTKRKGTTVDEENAMYLDRIFYYWNEDQPPITRDEAYIYAFGVMMCSIINVGIFHPTFMGLGHLGMRIRIACCSLIYRKSLRISMEAMTGNTLGSAVNLMTNDVTRFDNVFMPMHYLWIAPLQMVLCCYFMYKSIKVPAIIGICVVAMMMPLQAWLGLQTSIFRLKAAIQTDERMRKMNEIIQGMKVIKMYAWEHAFSSMIHNVRDLELQMLSRICYIRGTVLSFVMFTTRLAIFATVTSTVIFHDSLTAENVFMITSYYQILRHTMTLLFPTSIAYLAEYQVSVKRIQTYLTISESNVGDSQLISTPSTLFPASAPSIETVDMEDFQSMDLTQEEYSQVTLIEVSAKFENTIVLDKVSMSTSGHSLTAVIGEVGAGKSQLLHVIMGELEPFEGQLRVIGRISYAAQEPWLFAGTVRQNIVFGRPFNSKRYYAVVRACALLRDFTLLPFGDQTTVGERGIALSGGQRARINLARAVYKEADVYLLDDPLSAVDTNVGKHLFDKCIVEFLGDKVVILITHQLQYLVNVSNLVLMHRGEIVAAGDYESMKTSGLQISEFLKDQTPIGKSTLKQPDVRLTNTIKKISLSSNLTLDIIDLEGQKRDPRRNVEVSTIGSVGLQVYRDYFRAGGNCCRIATVVSLFLGAQILANLADAFLSNWVEMEEHNHHDRTHNVNSDDQLLYGYLNSEFCIGVYTILITLTIVSSLVRSFVFFFTCVKASLNLHDWMFNSVITATMHFFDVNSVGRILNRFSKDLGSVDELLPQSMIDCTQIMLSLLGAVVIVSIVNPYLLIPTVIMFYMFYKLRKYYLTTSRSVKRLDGLTRSPVLAHLSASIQGLPTIRSNGAERILVQEFDRFQDTNSSAWFMFIATSRAFGLWLDLISCLFMGTISFSFLFFEADGSKVGLAITQAIGMSGLLQWGLRQSAELENQMTSVERVMEYTRIDHESDLDSAEGNKPPEHWPSEGHIEFQNLVMKYSPDSPPVLHDLILDIQPREKIGIVGRTGAGKSSLMSALFRLSPYEGQLLIDEIDTTTVGLHDLRNKLSIIPQEPVIFSGSMRYNMDPFNQYEDEEIVNALVVVEIKCALAEGVGCLSYHMLEGGINISVGERQMLCLARAILRNNFILILDEATANVDAQTDKFIQNTIRTKFAHCTVLTIAHRLHTVMDSDRVLVMNAGIAVEFDHPHNLLQLRQGFLVDMVAKTGPDMEKNLRQIAKTSFDMKKKPKKWFS